MSDIRTLKQVLKQHRTIAVVGLSADWFRPSYFAAKYMQAHGYKIVPVNPKYPEILDEPCYPSLSAIPFAVDIVDVFRKPADIKSILLPIPAVPESMGITDLINQLVKPFFSAKKPSVFFNCTCCAGCSLKYRYLLIL